jgi:glucose/arabinose dehydrogenase
MSAVSFASLALASLLLTSSVFAQPVVPNGFQVQELAFGLERAVGFDFLPDGRILVIEQKQDAPAPDEGRVYLVVNGTVHGPILSITDVNADGLERGLLGVAADPAWPVRPYVYVQLTHSSGASVVRMYTASGDLTGSSSSSLSLGSPYDILTDLPDALEWHNGGTLRFGPDGMLYVSHGDDATDQCSDFQDPDRWHGVILRLDVSSLPGAGSGPPPKADITPIDNPFPGGENAGLTYCIGLRNPFRFNIDSLTGDLFIGDVGEADYEELNQSSGGENFGWPIRQGAHDYPAGQACAGIAGVDPIFEDAHDEPLPYSIISGPRYRPQSGIFDFGPGYDGSLFVLDFYAGWMRRLIYLSGTDEWVTAGVVAGQPNPTDWATGMDSVSDMRLGPDGGIYFTRMFTDAFLARIVKTPIVEIEEPTPTPLGFVFGQNPMRSGRSAAISFALDAPSVVTLRVFDVAGQLVAEVANARFEAGAHDVSWEGRATGTYFVRMDVGSQSLTRKLTVVR